MAHSNRKKLKASRGGMTRNQQRKARNQSHSSGSNRLQETINWLAKLEESKKNKPDTKVEAKIIEYPRDKRSIQKRIKVIKRLDIQLKDGKKETKEGKIPLQPHDIQRITKEINTLKIRV